MPDRGTPARVIVRDYLTGRPHQALHISTIASAVALTYEATAGALARLARLNPELGVRRVVGEHGPVSGFYEYVPPPEPEVAAEVVEPELPLPPGEVTGEERVRIAYGFDDGRLLIDVDGRLYDAVPYVTKGRAAS